ncbi:MAG: metallophosphoesterase [Alistipes sp.]
MMWVIIALQIIILAADLIVYLRKVRPANNSLLWRYGIGGALLFINLLPVAILLSGLLCKDNSTGLIHLDMWLIYGYFILSVPRLIFYLFAFIRESRLLRLVGALLALCCFLALLWGSVYGRKALLINRIKVCSSVLPVAFDGFRIVQFSDLHVGALVCPESEIQQMVDSINSLHPDLIVFNGDLVNIRYSELTEGVQAILGQLQAPQGVISVTGNHDVGVYIKDSIACTHEENLSRLIERQRAMGWKVLDNQTMWLHRAGDSISLSGISFDRTLRNFRHSWPLPSVDLTETYHDVPDSIYNITVAHLPQLWQSITALGYGELTLSGHVHGMQLKFKLFGHTYSPAQLLYAEWSGAYQATGSMLYINDGIGYVGIPMRLGAWPEITLFTLHRGA